MSLSITDLNVWIGDVHILRGITLEVPDGQHVGIIGASGSGKSMLSLAIMGLLPEGTCVEGSIRWDGRELVGASERELRSLRGSQISMMFQDPATSLDPLMRLGKQIALPLRRHRGLRGAALREAIDRALAEVALPDPVRIVRSFPYEVSGGQRQRVALAMTLAASPSLLIADEPTTALDVTIQAQILRLLERLAEERDMALVLITHDLGVIAGMVDRGAGMYAGRIVEERATSDLFAGPRHPHTKAMLACIPRPDETNLRISGIPGTPAVLRPAPRGCAFAPRCTDVIADCEEIDPQLEGLGTERVACIVAVPPGSPPGTRRASELKSVAPTAQGKQ